MAFSTIGLLQSWPKYQPPTFTFTYDKSYQFITDLSGSGYNVLILDSSGTLTFPAAGKDNVNYYVVGGGGGGGKGRTSGNLWGGNGGNGGVISTGRFNIPSRSTYNVVVGDGGFGFGQPYSITAASPAPAGTRTNNGGVTSIRGPSLDVSCNGGFVGTTPTTARTSNIRQSELFGLGGNGGLNDSSGNLATDGEDGKVFPPNNTYYGAGGGGGIQQIARCTPGNGGQTGGGNGSHGVRITTVEGVNTGIGSAYGAGGGGTGGKSGSLTGNAGFKGCVFLYWT